MLAMLRSSSRPAATAQLLALAWIIGSLSLPAWGQADANNNPDALLAEARQAIADGDYAAAVNLLEPAMQLYKAANNLRGVANAASEMMLCQLQLGNLDQAQQAAAQGCHALEQAGDLPGAARLATSFSASLRAWGQYQLAAEQLDIALALYTEAKDPAGQANTHVAQGVLADLMDDLPQANAYFAQARELFHSLGDHANEALCYVNEGYAQYRLGDLDDSLFAYQQALYLYQRLGLKPELAQTYAAVATAYRGMDQVDDAEREYETAALLFLDQDAKDEAAEVYYELGMMLEYAGKSEQALSALDLAWGLWEDLGEAASMEQMLPDLQVVLRNLGRGKEVAQYQERLRKAQQED